MNTKYRLAAGYILIIIVVLIAGLLSYGDLVALEENVDQIQVNYMPSIESLGRMSISASNIQRLLYTLTTEQDSLKIEEARRASLDIMTEVNSRHMIYSLRYITSLEEQELFDEAKKAWDKFLPEAKAIASDPWAASRWNDSAQLDQLMTYWQQIDEKIMSLIEYNAAESGRATKESVELVRAVKGKYLAGAATVVTLVLFVWGLTSRVITRSEDSLQRTVQELKASNEELCTSRDMYQLLIEGSHDVLWDWDLVNNKRTISARWQTMGFEEEAFLNRAIWRSTIHPADLPGMEEALEEHLQGLTPYYVCEHRCMNANGEYRWLLARGKALFDSTNMPVRMAGSYTDITEMKLQADRLYRHAYYDGLTGLPNFSQFSEKVSAILAAQDLVRGGLFYIDLDNFKLINDSYGHDWGNLFLVALVKRVDQAMPQGGLFCRVGGDEFAIALPGVTEEEAVAFAKVILEVMHEPFEINHTLFFTTASIGVVLYPEHGNEITELLRKADTAMYRAKESGKNSFCLFDSFMEAAVVERLSIESGLRQALVNDELTLHYQPIVNVADRRIKGFEALLRWNSKEHGQVPPLKFIPVAESTGMIIPIGEWVIKQACHFIKKVHKAGYPELTVAVNLSVNQLVLGNVITMVTKTLEEFQLEPRFLELEITESILMESSGTSIKQLENLAAIGVNVALDDFGTGYSSLTYLRQLPICSLKMDKTFVDNLPQEGNTSAKAIVEGVIAMAHKLGLTVIAEGVETQEQLHYLHAHSCDDAQGYFISRPIPEQEVYLWLQQSKIFE
ncbi:EAL domain-containing protein [Sporomusa sp.]|uniref:EAL domain-containing protein n=1 Tax=Sporomusa sp. TaxID=2078658 RepID=UPI002C185575|nr:EAL domain-containing protein [Sporomusa sp.]HWR42197.1 EAL domain-containing protein [Sporomusa sp.]